MANYISFVLATLVGLALWALVALLAPLASFSDPIGRLMPIVFFAPIGSLVVPALARQWSNENSMAWLLATAPIVGFLNVFLFGVCFQISRKFINAQNSAACVAAAVASGVWIVPLYFALRRSQDVPPDNAPEKPVKPLRRPGRW
jgi:hypothetical protein